jgi:hypothetical protein
VSAILVFLAVASTGAPHGCLDPDDSTPSGIRALDGGETCLKPRKGLPKEPVVPITPARQAQIKARFDTVLLDGVSARWKWQPQRSRLLYCGWVNAKNRMGAYSGWSPYYVMFEKSGRITSAKIVGSGDSPIVLETLCNSVGYNISSPQ